MEQESVKIHPLFAEAVLKDIDSRFVLDPEASSLVTSAIEEIINSAIEDEREGNDNTGAEK